jgi:nucleoside-diphosphate-sugar epimerase
MRVFVTGASGGIGSVVVRELIAADHEVLGLARSEESADRLTAAGASVLRGDLNDADILRASAVQCDGVIHGNDFSNFGRCVAEETLAAETFGAALEGTGKPLVFTSGTPAVPGKVSTEQDAPNTEGPAGGRGRNARAAFDLAQRGVRCSVVRLPRSVHRQGGPYGFASVLVAAAQRNGVSA